MRRRPKLTETRFDQWSEDLKSWIVESVSPFEDDTPQKQAARKARGEHDLLYFCATYLPHYFIVEFGDFHQEWEELTELRDQVALIGAPREHAKSTFITFAVPIRNICYVLRWFQLIVSDTNDQAVGFSLPIRLELEDNPRLRHDFADAIGRGRVWQAGDFTTGGGVRTLARGRGEKVRGLKNRQHRPDFAVVDDFENDENVENPNLIKKGLKYLKRAVIGSMGAGYTFIMVGNLFHPRSILSQLIAEKDPDGTPLYVSRVYDCWLDFGKDGQRPLWPALWPAERLETKRRQMSTMDFNAEMRNLVTEGDSPFPEEWFEALEFERIILVDIPLAVATFVDPSARSGENNDYKAAVTVGLRRDTMKFFCLHAWIRHASISEMFAAAYNQVDHYGGVIGIEENMLEDFLHETIYNYAKEVKRFLPWQGVRHSTNKEGRIIGTLQYLVEHRHIHFERHHSDQALLIEQLIYLLNKNINDDGPDALEGAVVMLQGGNLVYGSADPAPAQRGIMELRRRDAGIGDDDRQPGKIRALGGIGRVVRKMVARGRIGMGE